jgi:hypothetical protein
LTILFNHLVTVIGPTGIDLSKYPTNSSSRKTSTSQQQAQQQQHVDSRQTIPAELYASLLMQLRRASDVASAVSDASPGNTSPNFKPEKTNRIGKYYLQTGSCQAT